MLPAASGALAERALEVPLQQQTAERSTGMYITAVRKLVIFRYHMYDTILCVRAYLLSLVNVRMNHKCDLAIGCLDLGVCSRPCNAKDGVIVSHGGLESAATNQAWGSRALGNV